MLYAVAGTAVRIVGLPDAESAELLARLKAHATDERFVYRRRHEAGDIAIIDTQATLHSATPIEFGSSPRDSRVVWRISVHGNAIGAGMGEADRAGAG